jgi:hypothetical protein
MPCHPLQKSCNNHLSVAAWISLSACLIIYLSASLSVYLTISGSVSRGKSCPVTLLYGCFSVGLLTISVCSLYVCFSVCLLLYLSALYQSAPMYVYYSISLHLYMSACLFVCLSSYLWHSPALSPTPEIMNNHLSAAILASLSVCLLNYLSVSFSICLLIYLSVHLSISGTVLPCHPLQKSWIITSQL